MKKKLFILITLITLSAFGWGFWPSQKTGTCLLEQLYCKEVADLYEGYKRQSRYIELADGRKLAADILRPTKDGDIAKGRLPVLLTYTVYNRAVRVVHNNTIQTSAMMKFDWITRLKLHIGALLNGGDLIIDQAIMQPWIKHLIQQGYVVVAVDASGTGASYGPVPLSGEAYGKEGNRIIDWIIQQPWSNGKVGMYGQSFSSLTAYSVLRQKHPALKALYTAGAPLDPYREVGYPGGAYAKGFGDNYILLTSDLDNMIAPVDGDEKDRQLTDALKERSAFKFTDMVADVFLTAAFDDQPSQKLGVKWEAFSGISHISALKDTDVPIFNIAGWRDIFSRDVLFWDRSITAPKRLIIRNTLHRTMSKADQDFASASEARRWFDHWLKNKGEGPDKKENIRYFQLNKQAMGMSGGRWCHAAEWPPATTSEHRFYLSENNTLGYDEPTKKLGIRVDTPTATTGSDSRWNGVLGAGRYPEHRETDLPGTTFSLKHFQKPFELAGHSIVDLRISSAAKDAVVFAYLEKVKADGQVLYLTEGVLRASHRQLSKASYDNNNLPYHPHTTGEFSELTQTEPVRLKFDLLPIAVRFEKGEYLRLRLTNGDKDNFRPIDQTGNPAFMVHSSAQRPSTLLIQEAACLPAIQGG